MENIDSINAYQIKSLYFNVNISDIDENSILYKENKSTIDLNKDITNTYTMISTVSFGKKALKEEYNIEGDVNPIIISKEFADMIHAKEGSLIKGKIFQKEKDEFTIPESFYVVEIIDELPIATTFGSMTEVIVDYDILQKLYNTTGYDRIDVWLKDGTNLTSINSIKNLGFNHDVSVKTYDETIKYYQEIHIKNLLLQAFITGIFLFIAIANSFTSIFNNIVNRREEFNLLNTIGINKKEIKKSVLLEGILYGASASIFVIIIQGVAMLALGMKDRSIYVVYLLLSVDVLIILLSIIFSRMSMRYVFRS